MKRKDPSKDIVLVLAFTIFTVAVWVGFDVYRTLNKVEPVAESEELLAPLSPTLKLSVFNDLSLRNP